MGILEPYKKGDAEKPAESKWGFWGAIKKD